MPEFQEKNPLTPPLADRKRLECMRKLADPGSGAGSGSGRYRGDIHFPPSVPPYIPGPCTYHDHAIQIFIANIRINGRWCSCD